MGWVEWKESKGKGCRDKREGNEGYLGDDNRIFGDWLNVGCERKEVKILG